VAYGEIMMLVRGNRKGGRTQRWMLERERGKGRRGDRTGTSQGKKAKGTEGVMGREQARTK